MTYDRKGAVQEDPAAAQPFLKWAGGKRALLPEILSRAPARIGRYHEPFLGGGAAFFALADRIDDGAVLTDLNADLIGTFAVVRDRVGDLVEALREHAARHGDPAYFYEVRAANPEPGSVEAAARFVYLNRTCFNGLHRVNRAGRFNVPRGAYKNPKICDEPNLRACSAALKGVRLAASGYDESLGGGSRPGAGGFVYLDPPYDGTWDGYQSGGFPPEARARLRDVAVNCVANGARVLLSDSSTARTRRLYSVEPLRVDRVAAPRRISARASGRKSVTELLVVGTPSASRRRA